MLNPKRIKGAGATLLTVTIVSGLAVATLAERQYERLTTQEVWVATHELSIGHTVVADDLRTIRTDNSVAKLSITDPRSIIGRKLNTAKTIGDIIKQGDLSAPKKLGMTDVIPKGRVVYTLTPDAQLLPYTRQLRTGDSFDILATSEGGRVTSLATDVILLGTLLEGQPTEAQSNNTSLLSAAVSVANPNLADTTSLLVLAVLPEHVYPLASALGSSARISVVAYGKTTTSNENRLTVSAPQASERRVEVITGLKRAYVNVRKTAPTL
jgi:hypothetical protein